MLITDGFGKQITLLLTYADIFLTAKEYEDKTTAQHEIFTLLLAKSLVISGFQGGSMLDVVEEIKRTCA